MYDFVEYAVYRCIANTIPLLYDSRAVSTTLNNRDYLDHDLNRDSDSTFFSCVDTINAIISGI